MATARQIAANNRNAQRSTGPKSPEGKAKSCLNHLSHGFASHTARLIQGEKPEEFNALLADFREEHQPATPTEEALVELMVMNTWLVQRAFNLQTASFNIAYEQRKGVTNLPILIRYQSTAERAFHRAHTELVKAQKERKKSEIGFESQSTPDVNNAAADPPPNPSKPEPKTATITAEPASSSAPDAPAALEIVPEVPDSQNAAFKNAA